MRTTPLNKEQEERLIEIVKKEMIICRVAEQEKREFVRKLYYDFMMNYTNDTSEWSILDDLADYSIRVNKRLLRHKELERFADLFQEQDETQKGE